jgi:FkbM family methyltransferase
MDLVPGDMLSGSIAFTGLYELMLTRRVVELAKESRSGLMVDVGANLGYFTLLWLAGNPQNRVIAFEPAPRNVEFLRRNLEQNSFQDRVTVIEAAAGADRGRMPFHPGPASETGCGGLSAVTVETGFEVDVVRLDDVIPAHERVDLLKIDAEGSDTWALQGATRLLEQRQIAEIWYEQLKWRMTELGIEASLAEKILRARGYQPAPQVDAEGDRTEWRAVPSGPRPISTAK